MKVRRVLNVFFARISGLAVCLIPAAVALASDEATLTVGTGLDFSSGKYGSTGHTDTWYVPFSAKYSHGPSLFKVTVPYLRMSSPSGGTLIGVDENGNPIYSGTGRRVTEQGLGDVVMSYTHSLLDQPSGGFLVDVGGKIKFPTGDKDKGLSTGKHDYSVFADVYYLTGALTPFATVGYKVLGDPAGLKLRDVWHSTLGLAYKLSDRNSAGLMWDVREATRPGGEGINELTGYWVRKLPGGWKAQAYAVTGFSDASPDYGLGVMLSVPW